MPVWFDATTEVESFETELFKLFGDSYMIKTESEGRQRLYSVYFDVERVGVIKIIFQPDIFSGTFYTLKGLFELGTTSHNSWFFAELFFRMLGLHSDNWQLITPGEVVYSASGELWANWNLAWWDFDWYGLESVIDEPDKGTGGVYWNTTFIKLHLDFLPSGKLVIEPASNLLPIKGHLPDPPSQPEPARVVKPKGHQGPKRLEENEPLWRLAIEAYGLWEKKVINPKTNKKYTQIEAFENVGLEDIDEGKIAKYIARIKELKPS